MSLRTTFTGRFVSSLEWAYAGVRYYTPAPGAGQPEGLLNAAPEWDF